MTVASCTSNQSLWWQERAWSPSLQSLLLELPRLTAGTVDVEEFVDRPVRLSYQIGISNLAPDFAFLKSFYDQLGQAVKGENQPAAPYVYEPDLNLGFGIEVSNYDKWDGFVAGSRLTQTGEVFDIHSPHLEKLIESSQVKRAVNYAYSVEWTDEEARKMLTRLTGLTDPVAATRVALGVDSVPSKQASDQEKRRDIVSGLAGNPYLARTATGGSVFDVIARELVTFLERTSKFPASISDVMKVNHLVTNPETPLRYLEEAIPSLGRLIKSESSSRPLKEYAWEVRDSFEERLRGSSLVEESRQKDLESSRRRSDADIMNIAERKSYVGAQMTVILPRLMQDPSREGILREAAQVMLSRGHWKELACMTPVLSTLLAEAEEGLGTDPGTVPVEWLLEVVTL